MIESWSKLSLKMSFRAKGLLSTSLSSINPITPLFSNNEPGIWLDPSDVASLNWRRNLLTWSEQFDNAAWSKSSGSFTSTTETSPIGTATADVLTQSSGVTSAALFYINNTYPSTPASTTLTFSIYAKRGTKDFLTIGTDVTAASGSNSYSYFNLSNGTLGTAASGHTLSITPVGSGWYRCTLTATSRASTQNTTYYVGHADTNGSLTVVGSGNTVFWGAQLELGSTLTEYQRITNVDTETVERFPNNTLFKDASGTQPVTTPGDPVGLALDKSKGLVLGPELVTNGGPNFITTTGWLPYQTGSNFSIVNGNIVTVDDCYFPITGLTIGRTYEVRYSGVSGNGLSLYVDANSAGNAYVLNLKGSGVYRVVVSKTELGLYLNVGTSLASVSVKELPGFHATQATAGSRPIYGINPVGGRRNLLTRTEEFNTAPWQKIGAQTVTSDAAVAPNGTTTADKLMPSAVSDLQAVYQGQTFAAATYTVSVYAKAAEYSWLFVRVDGVSNGYVWFNLSNGTIGTQEAGRTGSISTQGNGWYRCSVTWTSTGGTGNILIGASNANATPVFTGNASNGIFLWGAQLETGSNATAYQKVTSQYDVTEAGVASAHYLAFDTSKFLVTPTITPGTDKVQVFAGVRKNSDATTGLLVEMGSGGTFRVFGITAPNANGLANYGPGLTQQTSGAIYAVGRASPFTAPITNVVTSIFDWAAAGNAGKIVGRVNAIAQTLDFSNSVGTLTAGNFDALPLYIGMRTGTSLPFNGNIYSLVVRFGSNLTSNQINAAETWVNKKTGAY